MRYANTLVSVGLPVRNGADRMERVVKSVLNQDHENLELVICDNASTDGTEELCRGLAARDNRAPQPGECGAAQQLHRCDEACHRQVLPLGG